MADIIKLKVSDNDTVVKPKVDNVEEVIKVIEVPIAAESVDRILDRSVTEITTDTTKIGRYALAYCDKLVTVNGPNVETLAENAFYYCTNLKNINMPNIKELGNRSLYECALQQEMTFPNLEVLRDGNFEYSNVEILNTPKLTTIKGRNFYRSKLQELKAPLLETLPEYFMEEAHYLKRAVFENCTSVGKEGFYSCGDSTTVIDLGHPETIGAEAFNYVRGDVYIRTPTLCAMTGPTKYFSGRFLVPANLVDAYKAAENWSDWADKIFAIEEV